MEKGSKIKRHKRANGEGHIRKLKSGYWEARITDGYNEQGKQKFKTFTNKKQETVIQRLNEFKVNRDKFKYENIIKYTIKEWLQIWHDIYVVENVRNSTRVSYEGIIKNYLLPYIGHIKLVELRKVDIEEMYQKILNKKINKKTNKTISVKSIRNIHLVLHKALEDALQREYILKNPASIAQVPTLKNLNLEKQEIRIYSVEEEKKLIEVAKNDKIYGTVVITALYTGMRKGELLGLQWKDIDFENKIISINKQVSRIKNYDENSIAKTKLCIQYNTKTSNSTRKIPLSESLKKVLEEHYKMQQKNKVIYGNLYEDNDMVFCKENGAFLDPDTVLQKYYSMVKKANITKCTFHALRHTFASRALENKIEAKVISSILGHSNVQFTFNTYTHVLNDLAIKEMERLDKYFNSIAV